MCTIISKTLRSTAVNSVSNKKLGCIYLIKCFPEHFEDLCVTSRIPLLNWHNPTIVASGLIASVDGEISPNMSLT